ncbi:MAG TPA: hypothetical protein VGF52_05595 [Tepidisphaeraceae bacterium]|jgi:uncharacterized membrane protein
MTNDHKQDRSRPWLLMGKVTSVAVYFGGLATVVFLWFTNRFTSLDLSDPRRLAIVNQISTLMIFLVVPALLLAMAIGTALLLRRPGYFLRTRWLWVKFLSLAIFIPCAHFFCSTRLSALRIAADAASNLTLAHEFSLGISAALAGSLWIVFVGRLKPRFGQNPILPQSSMAVPTKV